MEKELIIQNLQNVEEKDSTKILTKILVSEHSFEKEVKEVLDEIFDYLDILYKHEFKFNNVYELVLKGMEGVFCDKSWTIDEKLRLTKLSLWQMEDSSLYRQSYSNTLKYNKKELYELFSNSKYLEVELLIQAAAYVLDNMFKYIIKDDNYKIEKKYIKEIIYLLKKENFKLSDYTRIFYLTYSELCELSKMNKEEFDNWSK